MIDVKHVECGGVAIRMRDMLHGGDVLLASNFVHTDGAPAAMGEAMICDACRRPFSGLRSDGHGGVEAA